MRTRGRQDRSVATLQSPRGRLAGCSSWPLRFAVYSSGGNSSRKSSSWRWVGICAFSLSYRDVEELLAERGLHADHVTVWRWVQRYAPEMERRLRSELKPTNDSWRVDSDLHTGQGQVGLSIPRRGLDWGDDRLPSLGQAGRGCCGALPE